MDPNIFKYESKYTDSRRCAYMLNLRNFGAPSTFSKRSFNSLWIISARRHTSEVYQLSFVFPCINYWGDSKTDLYTIRSETRDVLFTSSPISARACFPGCMCIRKCIIEYMCTHIYYSVLILCEIGWLSARWRNCRTHSALVLSLVAFSVPLSVCLFASSMARLLNPNGRASTPPPRLVLIRSDL